jgi:transposase
MLQMANKTVEMNTIKLILQHVANGYSQRKTAKETKVHRKVVRDYLAIFKSEGYTFSNALALTDEQLAAITHKYKGRGSKHKSDKKYIDLSAEQAHIKKELSRTGVTRKLLWQEYKAKSDAFYSYTQFCRYVKQHQLLSTASMRFTHKMGEVLQVDFAGDRLHIIDKDTGELITCEVLIGTLPFSNYSVAVALPSQKQQDFIYGITYILNKIGGVPQSIKMDNLKSGVIKPDRYEPQFNNLLQQLSLHYNTNLQAARVAKPKDKASVEGQVNYVYKKVYATLRNQVFHTLAQLNDAICGKMSEAYIENFQGRDYSRQDLFIQEQKQLGLLPNTAFEVIISRQAKVKNNCHVCLGEDRHEYSVPYQYLGQEVQIQYNKSAVQIFDKSFIKIAQHTRNKKPYGYTTLKEHMPPAHQAYADALKQTAQYYLTQAQNIGTYTHQYIFKLLHSKAIVEQTYESCKGLLLLAKNYGNARLETACEMVKDEAINSYKVAKNILANKQDVYWGAGQQEPPSANTTVIAPIHSNQRGATYYT